MKNAIPINDWRTDLTGRIGAVIMLGFAAIAGWRWFDSGLIFYALVFFRDVAAVWFLLTRNATSTRRQFGVTDILAYTSCAMPLLYFAVANTTANILLISNILAIAGFTLSTLALFELGNSFGVSPANRGTVRTGVYKLFRHPMYVGYVVAEFGMVLLNPWNGIIFLLACGFYLTRAKLENKFLCNEIIVCPS